jgi:hypothetical protein
MEQRAAELATCLTSPSLGRAPRLRRNAPGVVRSCGSARLAEAGIVAERSSPSFVAEKLLRLQRPALRRGNRRHKPVEWTRPPSPPNVQIIWREGTPPLVGQKNAPVEGLPEAGRLAERPWWRCEHARHRDIETKGAASEDDDVLPLRRNREWGSSRRRAIDPQGNCTSGLGRFPRRSKRSSTTSSRKRQNQTPSSRRRGRTTFSCRRTRSCGSGLEACEF